MSQIADFFETHDMGEFWESMPPAEFEVDLKRRRQMVPIDQDLMEQLAVVARSKRLSAEALVNKWIKERLVVAEP